MTKVLDQSEIYWLPEDYVLKLTALEIGALLFLAYASNNDMRVNRPGPNGEPVETTMRNQLMKKIQDAIEERARQNEKQKPEPKREHA